MTRKRRFFSGPSLEAALVAAGNEYGLAPERVQYRPIEKKHGFLKIRRNVVIEVDPENPEKPAEETKKKAAKKAAPREEPREAAAETPEESSPESEGDEDGRPADDADGADSVDEDPDEDDEDLDDEDRGDGDEDEGDGGGEDGEEGDTDDDAPEPPDLEFADEEDERAYRAVMRGENLPPLRSRKRGDGKGDGGRQSKGKGRQEKGRDRSREKGREKDRDQGRGREDRPDARDRGRKDEGQKKSARGRSEGGQPERPRKPRDKKGPETETRSISRREPKDLQPIEKRLKKARGEKAEAALEASEWLLDLVDLDVDCQVYEGEERFEVEFRGRDRKFLVADSGKVLSALEHLIPRVMRGICGEGYPIRTDSENFQEMREERLKDEALETAARVRREGEPAILDAMDPADRRIVHITLTDDPEVTTRSLGDGFFKRVKILPK